MNSSALAYLKRAESALIRYSEKGKYQGFVRTLRINTGAAFRHHVLEPKRLSLNESVALHTLAKTAQLMSVAPTQEQVDEIYRYLSEIKYGTLNLIGTVEYVRFMKETGLDMGELKEPIMEYGLLLKKTGLGIREDSV